MADNKTNIWVYAHWVGMPEPTCIGILSAHQAKGKKAFSFEYDPNWIRSKTKSTELVHLCLIYYSFRSLVT